MSEFDDPAPRERVIDVSVEVVGTPEQVWAAIATGPGISSWFVPTTVEEQADGAITNRFGEGPEMLVPGRVAAWEPPARVVREVAGLMRAAADAGRQLPTLSLDADLRFATAADRAAFTAELAEGVRALAAKYHDESAPDGRWHRVVVAAYPKPPEEDS